MTTTRPRPGERAGARARGRRAAAGTIAVALTLAAMPSAGLGTVGDVPASLVPALNFGSFF